MDLTKDFCALQGARVPERVSMLKKIEISETFCHFVEDKGQSVLKLVMSPDHPCHKVISEHYPRAALRSDHVSELLGELLKCRVLGIPPRVSDSGALRQAWGLAFLSLTDTADALGLRTSTLRSTCKVLHQASAPRQLTEAGGVGAGIGPCGT